MSSLEQAIKEFNTEETYYNQFSIDELWAMHDTADNATKTRISLVIFNKEDELETA